LERIGTPWVKHSQLSLPIKKPWVEARVADLRNGKDQATESKGYLSLWACFWVNSFQWVRLSSIARTITLMTDAWCDLTVARNHFTSGYCDASVANWDGPTEVIPCNNQRLYG
jgi:hypothetical protein